MKFKRTSIEAAIGDILIGDIRIEDGDGSGREAFVGVYGAFNAVEVHGVGLGGASLPSLIPDGLGLAPINLVMSGASQQPYGAGPVLVSAGISLRADLDNGSPIWIRIDNAAAAALNVGHRLNAGDAIYIPLENASDLTVIGAAPDILQSLGG